MATASGRRGGRKTASKSTARRSAPKRSAPKRSAPKRSRPAPKKSRPAPKKSTPKRSPPRPAPSTPRPPSTRPRPPRRTPPTRRPPPITRPRPPQRPNVYVYNKPLVATEKVKQPKKQLETNFVPQIQHEVHEPIGQTTQPRFVINIAKREKVLAKVLSIKAVAESKEIQRHLTGEITIDPQRLQAIKEGRIFQKENIKATFELTPQKLKILQAMEKQKAREIADAQARLNATIYTFKGKDVTEQTLKTLEAQRIRQAEQKQKSQEMKNRTNEQILKNFIKTQLEKERTQDTGTNFTKYVKQEGFDPNKPETIPTTIFQPTKLDTAEKMLKAGLAPRIVNIRLESMGKQKIQRLLPTAQYLAGYFSDTIAVGSTKYGVLAEKVNYSGLKSKAKSGIIKPKVIETNFVPQIQHEVHKPVGMDIPTVKTTPLTTTQVVAKVESSIEPSGIKLAIPLLIGLFIL